MEVDPNKIVERLANQVAQQSLQIAALQAQLETVVDAYNELVAPQGVESEVAENVVAEPIRAAAEAVVPDAVFSGS